MAYLGPWREMLIPFVRERLSSRLFVYVNDHFYTCLPGNGQKDLTHFYMFQMTRTYLTGLQAFCMGVRRNNADYVKAGQAVFSPIFHRNNGLKYAMVDLHDRNANMCNTVQFVDIVSVFSV